MEFNTQIIAGICIVLVALGPLVPKAFSWLKVKVATVKDDLTVADTSEPTRNTVVAELLPIGDHIASLGMAGADTAYSALIVELMKGQPKN